MGINMLLLDAEGGDNNLKDDMHGENCASCKFHVGDSSTGVIPPDSRLEEPADVVQPAAKTEQKEHVSENVDIQEGLYFLDSCIDHYGGTYE
ncbi:hypothetical protein YC2023_059655 [Brassica napus]